MTQIFNKDSLIFGIKVVIVWILLNIPVVFLATPLILMNKSNVLFTELVGAVINIFTFPLALILMFRNSKLDSLLRYKRGLYAYSGLLLFQITGLLGNRTIQHFISFIITVSITYLALLILSKKKFLR